MSSSIRLAHLRMLEPPPYKPVEFTQEPQASQLTKTDVSEIPIGNAPNIFKVQSLKPTLDRLHHRLHECLFGPSWHSHTFEQPGTIHHLHGVANRSADIISPSGEVGLSHLLQTALFDKLNNLLWIIFPVGNRFWKVLGRGPTGTTDWGLFVEDKLVVIVELKPNEVSYVPLVKSCSPEYP